tara:strand:- start:1083 stop:1307 length:225 start_codon:yes stop_codon:yes gene_type:complete
MAVASKSGRRSARAFYGTNRKFRLHWGALVAVSGNLRASFRHEIKSYFAYQYGSRLPVIDDRFASASGPIATAV